MIQRKVAHDAYPYQLEAAPFRSDNEVTSRPYDGSLPDFGPIIQVLGPTALEEVADLVYELVGDVMAVGRAL